MAINRFSETKLYRRIKYFLFLMAMTIPTSIATFFAYLIWKEYGSNHLSTFHSYINSDQSTAPFPVEFIANLLYESPFWLVVALSIGTVLYFLEYVAKFVLRYVGWVFTIFQKLMDSGHFSSGGNARFAGMFEEYHAKKDSGIYYGQSLFKSKWLIYDNDDRHMLTIAGSRSGKGASVIIPNLLKWEHSVLCIDPKGTNTHVTAAWRRKLGNSVFVIDPFNMVPDENPAYFNPISIIDPNSITVVEDIRMISESLIPPDADGKNVHFTEGAKTLLDGYITHVVTSGDYKNPSLIDVYNIINMDLRGGKAVDIHGKMNENTSCGGLANQTAQKVLEGMGTNEFASVISTLKTNLKWLASEAFRETLTHSSFSFEEMKDTPTSVYLVIPPDMLKTHRQFLRLFISVAASRYTRGGKAKIPGLFIIDECPALGHMEEIAKAYGELASYNIIMWTFFQDKGQLDELYGARAETFIGSSRAVQVFNVRSKDADWVSEMIGTRGAVNGSDDNKNTEIKGFRDAGSIDTEVGGRDGLQYILRAGEPTMLLQRTPYYKTIPFKNMAGIDPDHRPPPPSPIMQKLSIIMPNILGTVGGLMFIVFILNIISDLTGPINIANWAMPSIGSIFTTIFSIIAIFIISIVLFNVAVDWLGKRSHKQHQEKQKKDREQHPERLAFYAEREYRYMRKQVIYSFAIPDWVPTSKYVNFPPELIDNSQIVNLHISYSTSRTAVGDLLLSEHNQDDLNYLIGIVEQNTKAFDAAVEKALRGE